ncbi:large-conductance mechanosensitive channel protein MscL [soil metagenome]
MLKSFADEFKAFIMRGNVIDLAVGVVIGTAFGAIVDTIVKGLFMPIIGLLTGGINFAGYQLTLWGESKLAIGMVIQATINFVIIGFCLFLVVKAMNKFKKKEEAKPVEPTESEKLLAEIRDLLKK